MGSMKMKYKGIQKEILKTMTTGIIKKTMEEEGDMYKAIRKKGVKMEQNKNREGAERVDNKREMEKLEKMEKLLEMEK